MSMKDIGKLFRTSPMDKSRYRVRFRGSTREAFVEDMKLTILTYGKSDMDKYLMNRESSDLLYFYSLNLPSYYKDKSLKELQEAFEKSTEILTRDKDIIKNVADYNYNSMPGRAIAYPKKGEKAKEKSKQEIKEHNIMEIYNYNLNQLRDFKEKTGTGILHFSNPLQLLDRLELLAGSLLAGNNGVIQEFSQIAHLLHQLKVITKKQLNDLLKKYILNK